MRKRILLPCALVIAFCFAFVQPPTQKLKVEMPLTVWENKLNVLDYTRGVILNSDISVKVANQLVDSIVSFENEISAQLKEQIKDSTTKK